jgi:serine/threonine protein kinase
MFVDPDRPPGCEGRMPPPITRNEDFLGILRRSGVIEEEELSAFLSRQAEPLASPEALAEALVQAGLLTSFQTAQLLKGKWKGFLIAGKYRLLDLLGVGGMGRVFLCEHVRMRRRVALKVLPTDQANDPGAVKRFDREARAVAALSHPNIVQAYDIDHDGTLHFLVMEYVDGISLNDYVRRYGPLETSRACHYVAQAALGLQHAHDQAGLVHRDIKPGNLLLARDGTVKVLDLGLARFFHDRQDNLTQQIDEKSVLGTADYLAPEQAIDSSTVDIRADIYSLGATFYFLLVGRPPFADGTVAQKLLWHQMREPESVNANRPDVPDGVAAVLARMMAKDPAARFQQPAEVADALVPWAEAAPPPEEPDASNRAGRPDSSPTARPRVFSSAVSAIRPPSRPISSAGDEQNSAVLTPPPRSHLNFPPSPTTGRPGWPRLAAWAGSILALVGVGVALWRFIPSGHGPVEPRPGAGRPRGIGSQTLFVGRSGRPDHFPTIKAALAECQPGDRVSVTETPWTETLHLTARDMPTGNVTVEGRTPAGETVILRPGPDHTSGEPLLRIDGVPGGLRIERFTIDGQNRCENLVELTGTCPGFALEWCHLQGFKRGGIHARQVAGQPSQPVVLRQLTFLITDQYAVGVALAAGKDRIVRHLQLRDSYFEGTGRAAVLVAGDVADVVAEGNRFSSLQTGVFFVPPKDQPFRKVQLRIANNTFYLLPAALEFDRSLPSAKPADALVVTNNLFVKITQILRLPGGKAAGDRLDGLADGAVNACEPARPLPPGAELFGCKPVSVEGLNLRADDGAHFLRYTRESPLASAGTDGGPVGVPPE